MLPHGEAVVGGEDDVGVIRLTGLLQLVEDLADLGIHVGDDGVVFLAVFPERVWRPGEWGEALVTQVFARAHGFGVRVFRQEIFRHRDVVERIEIDKLLGRLPGIVRRVEGDVHEGRVFAFGGA